jgi:hypothetical protein
VQNDIKHHCQDSESRLQICEERSWSCIESTTGLLASPIPLVLKGAFCKFLAALAVDEASTINIWNGLLSEGICVRQADGRLIGIQVGFKHTFLFFTKFQQDLDERECQLKIYDCTEGFLILLKELLSHKTRPNTQQISPYLQFIVGSVLCQFSTRSYEDANQMVSFEIARTNYWLEKFSGVWSNCRWTPSTNR